MKQCIIMSGVSGSGKSTYAEKYLNGTQGVKVSADHYFMGEDGYHFDPSKLTEAHTDCFRRFLDFCQKDVGYVVVDNTNTETWEIAPYYAAAMVYGYQPEVRTIDAEPGDILMLVQRNLHGVGKDAILAQGRRLAARELPRWWKHTYIPMVR